VHRGYAATHRRHCARRRIDPAVDREAVIRLIGVQLQQAGLQAKLTVREALGL
jgi:hypothetical protein